MKWTSLKWIKLRILFISMGFAVSLGLILFRSYHLQIIENARINRLAQRQYQATVPVQPRRGTIYDRNGKALAVDVQVASVAMHPHLIENPHDVVTKLDSVFPGSSQGIKNKINSKKKFEWIERRISQEKGDEISRMDLKGISIVPEYRRFYPNKELAGNLLGAVGYDAKALGGVELSLDSFLKSSSGNLIANKDAKGRLYTPVENNFSYHHVYLTIDESLQFIAEKKLWDTAQKFKVKNGFAIILDPSSGEILAMANYPALNPNSYWEYPMNNWKNHALVDSYEPGSTFKTVVVAASLQSGKVKYSDHFYCENGTYTIGKNVIHDHAKYQNLSVTDIVRLSSNIGVTKIAQKVGKYDFYDMIINLGFGQKTGIYLPGEEPGFIQKPQKWKEIDLSNIAFGQGIAVNGLQMAQAYATIANGGIRMKPYLVKKIVNAEDSVVVENRPLAINQPISEEVAKNLVSILKTVVHNKGTGRLAELEGYEVSGKTGTAQKVNAVTKKYDSKDYVSSFIGFVPAYDPSFLIYVVYDSPHPVHVGGLVAAPTFKEIAKEALAYKGIPPKDIRLALTP